MYAITARAIYRSMSALKVFTARDRRSSDPAASTANRLLHYDVHSALHSRTLHRYRYQPFMRTDDYSQVDLKLQNLAAWHVAEFWQD